MAATLRTVMNLLKRDRALKLANQAVFGIAKRDAWLLVNTAEAPAACQVTLTSLRTAFDNFADAPASNDSTA